MTQDTKVFLKQHLKRLAEIGIALTSEKNTGKILEMIISEAMDFARAITDEQGRFVIDEIADGEYRLIAQSWPDADGSITVPEALRAYMGGMQQIKAKE